MISKEAVIGFTLWLATAIGVGASNGGITKQEAPEPRYSSVSVASQQIRLNEPNVALEAPAQRQSSKRLLCSMSEASGSANSRPISE